MALQRRAAERGAFRRKAIGGGDWVVVVVCRKGSETIEERNEVLKMACMPRESPGEEETGETEWRQLKSL
jgi:hypothetical protein